MRKPAKMEIVVGQEKRIDSFVAVTSTSAFSYSSILHWLICNHVSSILPFCFLMLLFSFLSQVSLESIFPNVYAILLLKYFALLHAFFVAIATHVCLHYFKLLATTMHKSDCCSTVFFVTIQQSVLR
jgi:hypothetical protein